MSFITLRKATRGFRGRAGEDGVITVTELEGTLIDTIVLEGTLIDTIVLNGVLIEEEI